MSDVRNALEAAIREAVSLPRFSPSAPYDLRRIALEKVGSGRWWEQYPEGQCAAAVFRVWRALGIGFWEEEGKELADRSEGQMPSDPKVIRWSVWTKDPQAYLNPRGWSHQGTFDNRREARTLRDQLYRDGYAVGNVQVRRVIE